MKTTRTPRKTKTPVSLVASEILPLPQTGVTGTITPNIRQFGLMFQQSDEQLPSLDAEITPEAFTRVVLTLVRRYNISYFDAILEVCDHYDREYESVKALLTPKLKLALTEELSQRRLLKDKTFLLDKLG